MVGIMDKYEPCLDLGKTRPEELKIRYFSAFKPNTPKLHHSIGHLCGEYDGLPQIFQ
jgi:hypothetical protein